MPIHDWTRVSAGTWHAFHLSWISQLQGALNGGLLPADYYCQAEPPTGDVEPDVLTLQEVTDEGVEGTALSNDTGGGLALATAPPKTKFSNELELDFSARKRRNLVIRHNSGDSVVALIELVSPGNKSSKKRFDAFIDKAIACLQHDYHLLIIDLFPASRRDPNGIHGAIAGELGDNAYEQPEGEPLTLVSYRADVRPSAYIEPTAVGQVLTAMPLFLSTERYINVPLEETYMAAFKDVPRKYKAILES
jgi:hypothetical protein